MIWGIRTGEIKAEQLDLTGSVFGFNSLSGLNSFASASGTFARINDTNGFIKSVSVGSPGAFGAFVQAGSVATTAGSTATITLKTNFANAQFSLLLTPNNLANGAGSVVPYVLSGTTTKTISGADMVGAASTQYNYLAIGI